MNQLTILGFLGQDATLKTTKNGTQVLSFSLATKETWKSEGGRKEATTWHSVVAYGDGFAKLSSYLQKGAQVLVQGRLSIESKEREFDVVHNKKSIKVKGKQTYVECVAQTIRLLDRKAKDDNGDETLGEEDPV